MALAIPMASFDGVLAYGNAIFNSATEICEVEGVTATLTRERLDASPRCSAGKKVYIAGDLDTEISFEAVALKSGSNTSETDDILGYLLANTEITHVWVVDEYYDGIYFASGIITNATINQARGAVIRVSVSISPSTDVYQVLNKVISSS
jgi:hypothetical protein